MNFLVIGAGGREHALVWALNRSAKVGRVYCAPGNAGIAKIAECVPLKEGDFAGIAEFCQDKQIDHVVVGPEAPLAAGIADFLTARNICVFGPSQSAAKLEASKHFTKEFCARHAIPTAASMSFAQSELANCLAYVRAQPMPLVIKADGLAAGKGVTIAADQTMAEQAVNEAFSGRFGDAGARLVIEEFMPGVEASLFAACSGRDFCLLGTAQDYKRVGDGDQGPNTGGMGAISPAPALSQALIDKTLQTIVQPTLDGMAAEGAPFTGFLYAGLMVHGDDVRLVEYNVRFGDPECQVLLPLMTTDMAEIIAACAEGRLGQLEVERSTRTGVGVVLASEGYPGSVNCNSVINIPDALAAHTDVLIFHAGTQALDDGTFRPTGGRTLNIVARGANRDEARDRAYDAVKQVDWPGGFCRSDIGL